MDIATARQVLLVAMRSGDERVIRDAERALNEVMRRAWVEQAARKLAGLI